MPKGKAGAEVSSWSKSRKAMRISPLSPLCRIVTFVPSASASFS